MYIIVIKLDNFCLEYSNLRTGGVPVVGFNIQFAVHAVVWLKSIRQIKRLKINLKTVLKKLLYTGHVRWTKTVFIFAQFLKQLKKKFIIFLSAKDLCAP